MIGFLRGLPRQVRTAVRVWRRDGTLALFREVGHELERTWGLRLPRLLRRRLKAPTPAEAYAAWRRRHDPSADQLAWQRDAAPHLPARPLLSLVTPVYNPPVPVLRAMLDSVLNQTYDHWELCLADGSTDPLVRDVLRTAAAGDARLRVTFLEENLGISANTNAALALAQGEFVGLLDHDDVLAPHALYEVAREVNLDPAADLIYFDEDKLSAEGAARCDPFFKPAWSPELLLSLNYLTHCFLRRSLLERAGGFDPTADGCQDWDVFFRVTPLCRRIVHIPQVLYHWRKLPTSEAGGNAKPYAHTAQPEAIARHLRRLGLEDVAVEVRESCPVIGGRYRVRWRHAARRVSIVIPTKDKVDLLERCIDSILKYTAYAGDYEIVVVDTGSTEAGTRAYYDRMRANPRFRVVECPGPFNYSRANNVGVRHARGDVFAFLNNDTEVRDGAWLDELVQWAERKDVGAAGALLFYKDGVIQHAGVLMGFAGGCRHFALGVREEQTWGLAASASVYRNFLAVTAACLAMRREVLEEVGGWDEGYRLQHSDVDLCLQAANRGYRIVFNPFVRLTHDEHQSHGGANPGDDMLRRDRRMAALMFSRDPSTNPNLASNVCHPVLRTGDPLPPARLLNQTRAHFGIDRDVRFEPNDTTFDALHAAWNVKDLRLIPFVTPEKSHNGILLLSPSLDTVPAARFVLQLASALRWRGRSVIAVAPTPGPLRDAYDRERIPLAINPLVEAAPFSLPTLFAGCGSVVAAGLDFAPAVCAAQAAGKPTHWLVADAAIPDSQPENGRAIREALAHAARVFLTVEARRVLSGRFATGHAEPLGALDDPATVEAVAERLGAPTLKG